jgi:hypothetical protein
MRLEGWGGPPNSGLPEFGILMWERACPREGGRESKREPGEGSSFPIASFRERSLLEATRTTSSSKTFKFASTRFGSKFRA